MTPSYSVPRRSEATFVDVVSPLRIDLFGNWSDHPDFLDVRPSRVINTAFCFSPERLPVRVRLGVGVGVGVQGVQHISIDLGIKRHISFDHLIHDPVLRPLLDYYNRSILEEVPQKLRQREGIDLTTISDVAIHSGLGTSSALTVCVLLAVDSIIGAAPSKIELAERAYAHESAVSKCGWQDHYSSVFGRSILVERTSMTNPARVIELPEALINIIAEYGSLVFVSTHAHPTVHWRVEGNEKVVLEMDDILEAALSQLPTLTLRVLTKLLRDSEKLSRIFLPSEFCRKLDVMLDQFAHLKTCGFLVGMGPAAVILSEHPKQVRKILTEQGVPWHRIFPAPTGALLKNSS